MNAFYSYNSQVYVPQTFDDFLIFVISSMDAKIIKNSLSRSASSNLYERQFQNEFYRCAIHRLGKFAYAYPDVGQLFGSHGYLDYYIPSNLLWAVELVRDSDKLQEHADRFSSDGKYSNIPMKEYKILNFCYCKNLEKQRLKAPKVKNEWLVLYNTDDDFVILRYQIKTSQTAVVQKIQLRGHELGNE